MTDRPVAAGAEPQAATVAEISERELIDRIRQRLPPAPPWMLIGIGDDAAVVETARNRAEVLTVDALVEGVHFDRRFVPPDAIGYRALAVNLSDLAAMGAEPRAALLSFALPATLPLDDFDGIVAGLTRLAAAHRLHVAGGNLTRSPGPLMLDVTVIGSVKPQQALTRSGARPGDELFVSGRIGAAGAGLEMLKARLSGAEGDAMEPAGTETASRSAPSTSAAADESPLDACIERYLYPAPRVRLGVLLARNRAATACIDLSDGLLDGIERITQASGVGAVIEGDSIPIDEATRSWFELHHRDPMGRAMAAGDDYELLFAVRPRRGGHLAAARQYAGIPLTRIGVCTKDPAVVLRRTIDGASAVGPLPRDGYHHFR